MSKCVADMLADIANIAAEGSCELLVLAVTLGAGGEAEETKWVAPVSRVQFDGDSQECLFHVDYECMDEPRQSPTGVTLADVLSAASKANRGYDVCVAHEVQLDGSRIRIDTPIIGFGENAGKHQYFVVIPGDPDTR